MHAVDNYWFLFLLLMTKNSYEKVTTKAQDLVNVGHLWTNVNKFELVLNRIVVIIAHTMPLAV